MLTTIASKIGSMESKMEKTHALFSAQASFVTGSQLSSFNHYDPNTFWRNQKEIYLPVNLSTAPASPFPTNYMCDVLEQSSEQSSLASC